MLVTTETVTALKEAQPQHTVAAAPFAHTAASGKGTMLGKLWNLITRRHENALEIRDSKGHVVAAQVDTSLLRRGTRAIDNDMQALMREAEVAAGLGDEKNKAGARGSWLD